jgi:tetratricopeptide (TPR) repeat protein/DNA-binding XRE family transcriptional regulator
MAGEAETPDRAFGELIRSHRTRLWLTQAQLARRSGVSVRAIRSWEQGKVVQPRNDSVLLLADALGLCGDARSAFLAAARTAAKPVSPAAGQLPPCVSDFTGRHEQVALLEDLLGGVPSERPSAVVISALAGKAGVGKTALAVQVGHRLRARFPDGQLYVNLRGAERQALDPGAVLSQFLRALGVDGSVIPEAVEERAALYRARLADRRVLVVLDNTADEAQVRPLLPGTAGCSVLVTSRSRLAGLEGARLVDLDVLETGQAIELLGRIAGDARVAHEPEAATAIVDYCGRLPLAVRVAGARLAARPAWPLRRLVDLLADERRRLDHLSAGDLDVRASLGLSYRALGAQQRRTFRLLGLLDVADFAAWVAAPLLDTEPAEAERLVEDLVDAQLLDVAVANGGGPVRYRFHDLLRVYARGRAHAEEEPNGLTAAITRALAAWLALAERAEERFPCTSDVVTVGTAPRWHLPAELVDELIADPNAWFETEQSNLVVAVETAAAVRRADLAWEIAGCLTSFCLLHGASQTWRRAHEVALGACLEVGDRRGEAAARVALGLQAEEAERRGNGSEDVGRSVSIFRKLGDRRGEARALIALSLALVNESRSKGAAQSLARARAAAERAVTLARDLCNVGLERDALFHLARVHCDDGSFDEASAALEAERRLLRPHEHRDHAQVLWKLGEIQRAVGHRDQAGRLLRQALVIIRRIPDRIGEACVLLTLGELSAELMPPDDAIAYLTASSSVCRDVGERPVQARATYALGQVHARLHQHHDAAEFFTRAARLFAEIGDRRRYAEAMAAISGALAAGVEPAPGQRMEREAGAKGPRGSSERPIVPHEQADSHPHQAAGRTQPV